VHDLPGGRFGLLLTIHHCLVDGLSIMEIFSTLCTAAADPPPVTPSARPSASSRALAVRRPKLPHEHLLSAARLVHGAPATILNAGRPSAQREVHSVTLPLEAVHSLRRGLGVTVNTVVLSIVSGALRRFFDATGSDLRDVVAFVPVNRRVDTERGFHGNQIAMTYPRLPVSETDPRRRVDRVVASTTACGDERQADTTAGLIALTGLAPDRVAAVANRAFQFHAGIFNLTITNVPGPPVPVYFLGRQLRTIVGSTPLTQRHALTIAAVSYNGQLTISVTTDPARLPTGSRLVDDLQAAFVELQATQPLTCG
jgi:diacylglycerol O-acyltransferase